MGFDKPDYMEENLLRKQLLLAVPLCSWMFLTVSYCVPDGSWLFTMVMTVPNCFWLLLTVLDCPWLFFFSLAVSVCSRPFLATVPDCHCLFLTVPDWPWPVPGCYWRFPSTPEVSDGRCWLLIVLYCIFPSCSWQFPTVHDGSWPPLNIPTVSLLHTYRLPSRQPEEGP